MKVLVKASHDKGDDDFHARCRLTAVGPRAGVTHPSLYRGNIKGTDSSKMSCLMFVYVCAAYVHFVPGLILYILENVWFDDLCAE